MSDYFGKEVPKLGFGLMRLPKKGFGTDIEQVKTMVDLFLAAGRSAGGIPGSGFRRPHGIRLYRLQAM